MLIQPARSTNLRVLPTTRSAGESNVAIVLNTNARGVSERVIHSLSHTVSEDDLFISRAQSGARRIARPVLARQYPIVFCGGGDGTFVVLVNELFKQVEQFP